MLVFTLKTTRKLHTYLAYVRGGAVFCCAESHEKAKVIAAVATKSLEHDVMAILMVDQPHVLAYCPGYFMFHDGFKYRKTWKSIEKATFVPYHTRQEKIDNLL